MTGIPLFLISVFAGTSGWAHQGARAASQGEMNAQGRLRVLVAWRRAPGDGLESRQEGQQSASLGSR